MRVSSRTSVAFSASDPPLATFRKIAHIIGNISTHFCRFQICNAGFLVPPAQRGHGIGTVLARSYLHYGPRLGYEASVFNLVYVNNVASVKLWEALNFTKAGRIPRAGRLRTADGTGEEYVDAWVFYRRFDPVAV
ncbi:hypothetical protein BN946_scf184875.g9 [Trametes cinnabarina]|uniref:N-acetyltransferase domain-containing protein n=1 Tax=Pycnoporus cinnabarinus TaxID=5643 RepID=A0A060S5W4_PYCCI|nr:hypothetical protein BN946_scf184875.g9 [Trametes cinnabarina]